ncbi:MAG TPA: nuclear transport factor 2 family protein [Streptosporangiaceae bacterium]
MHITADDRFAIQDLCATYCQTVDRADADGWANTFTADGKRIYDDNPGAPGRAGRTFTGRAERLTLE